MPEPADGKGEGAIDYREILAPLLTRTARKLPSFSPALVTSASVIQIWHYLPQCPFLG